MIILLQKYTDKLSVFKNNEADALLYITRFNVFYPLFILYSLFWIVYEAFCYQQFMLRPSEAYHTANYFSTFFIPAFPSTLYFYSIASVGIVTSLFLIIKNINNIISRILILFVILWLNSWHWSFGFASHVGHVFLLFHLFSLFIPIKADTSPQEQLQTGNMIRWFLAGIVTIYTWSAAWKIITLAYKLYFQPNAMTWLNPDAQLINAISGYIIMDEEMGWKMALFQYPLVWQMMFVGVELFLLLVPILVLNPRFLNGVFLLLFLFHLTNIFITRAEFIATPTIYLLFILSGVIAKYKKPTNQSEA